MAKALKTIKNILGKKYPYNPNQTIEDKLKYHISINKDTILISFALPIGKEDLTYAVKHVTNFHGSLISNDKTYYLIYTIKIKNTQLLGPHAYISQRWPSMEDTP